MHLYLKVEHREIEIHTGRSVYLKTTFREAFLTLEREIYWWPFWEHSGKNAGIVTFLWWRLTYSVPEHQFAAIRR